MTAIPVQEQIRILLEGQIDIGIMAFIPRAKSVASEHLFRGPLMVALPENHPLAHQEIIPLAALATESWIWLAQHINAQHNTITISNSARRPDLSHK
jgi:DNA-binding transcriptional LysR family regulator